MSESSPLPWRTLAAQAILSPAFRRATFGGPLRGGKPSPWVRVAIRPVELRGQCHLQFAYFDARKNITKNFLGPDIEPPLQEILDLGFAAIHIATDAEDLDIHTSKKGTVRIGRRQRTEAAPPADLAHNRAKDLPLPEGQAHRLLEVMGISTRGGAVKPTRRAKYTQINEFLRHLRNVLDDAGLLAAVRELTILDCGCGLSYLTLAVHYYLNNVLGVAARILGVDVNEEVIRKSMQRSACLGAKTLQFSCGPIRGVDLRPDIVLALHACDTATDDALAQAVRGQAKVILSVPCCHHHLNARLRAEGPARVLRPLLRHGILHQRAADLVTDAFRALALRLLGYRTEVVEFISPEHTTRNLMIRAIHGAPVGDPALVKEYLEMRRFWGVAPYLEEVLGADLRGLLPESEPRTK